VPLCEAELMRGVAESALTEASWVTSTRIAEAEAPCEAKSATASCDFLRLRAAMTTVGLRPMPAPEPCRARCRHCRRSPRRPFAQIEQLCPPRFAGLRASANRTPCRRSIP
jgi:hypothetical protein